MLRCSIVGLGRWGRRLVDACKLEGKPIGDLVDFTHAIVQSPDKHIDYCDHQKLVLGTDYQQLLEGDEIDAVVLATPHSHHFEQIVAAASAGKHVFVEKPFTLSADEAQRAAESVHSNEIILAVGHNRRFLPALQRLKHLIDDGQLGTITHMEGNFSGPFGLDYDKTMWRANSAESPAGGMTAMGIHVIDAFIYLGGPIAEVNAQSLRLVLDVDMDDTTSAMMRFENGASAYLSTLCATARQWRLQVFGTKGWAQLRDHDVLDVCRIDQQAATTENYAPVDIERAELHAFAEACRGGVPYPVSLDEAVHGIAVQDAIIESAHSALPMHPVRRQGQWHPAARGGNIFPGRRI
ncbi:MAG: Gfo/Idh/MocA family oxidoreductase [Woeseia sp.]